MLLQLKYTMIIKKMYLVKENKKDVPLTVLLLHIITIDYYLSCIKKQDLTVLYCSKDGRKMPRYKLILTV